MHVQFLVQLHLDLPVSSPIRQKENLASHWVVEQASVSSLMLPLVSCLCSLPLPFSQKGLCEGPSQGIPAPSGASSCHKTEPSGWGARESSSCSTVRWASGSHT
jgi:hypothetical protein